MRARVHVHDMDMEEVSDVCASITADGGDGRQHNVLLLGAWLLSSVLQPAG